MEAREIYNILEPYIDHADVQKVKVIHSVGRVCAKDILAQMDIPNFFKSKYDGFTIHYLDYGKWIKFKNLQLKIIDKIGAGHSLNDEFVPGTTYHIMTGAEIPKGTQYVIPYEMVENLKENHILIKNIDPQVSTITEKGSQIQKGQRIIKKNEMIGRQSLFKITDQGYEYVDVYKKPIVSIISTGDEILEIGMPYKRGKIYNSTSFAIAGDIVANGGKLHAIGHAADDMDKIIAKIEEYFSSSNMIITTGGLGDGTFDYTKKIHKYLYGNIIFEKMDKAPRMIVSKVDRRWIISCSGSPNATFFSLDSVVLPIIKRMLGNHKIT